MHDSLGHELSLIALRAGALELSPTLTGQDREDLAVLRAAVSDAVGHLRDTIGVLRDGSEGEAPTASPVETVEELVARTRESGVTVHLGREGSPRTLPPLVDRSAYRVVQESLTKARHPARPGGPGAPAHRRRAPGDRFGIGPSARRRPAQCPAALRRRLRRPGRVRAAGARLRRVPGPPADQLRPGARGLRRAAPRPGPFRGGAPPPGPAVPVRPGRRSGAARTPRHRVRVLPLERQPAGTGRRVQALLHGLPPDGQGRAAGPSDRRTPEDEA
ncbi:sensor histidine kinase [Streptomyces sp. NPDC090046]|uniref:sensor histidine kinase n=1 Tax=Streptomyces sp. NPDC090046 TaxID=3365928 RepID=UPI00381C22FD